MKTLGKIIKAISGSIIFILVGVVLLAIGIGTLVKYGGGALKAKNYVPQEVTVIDVDNTLKQPNQLKAALKKYSDKAAISIKLVVNYKFNTENGDNYSDRMEQLPDGPYDAADTFLSFYDEKNKLTTDDRTLIIGMTYDSYSMDFVEFSGASGTCSEDFYKLCNSQRSMLMMFQHKFDNGAAPEQAVIDSIEENLQYVDAYFPTDNPQGEPYSLSKYIMISGIFLLMGLVSLGSGVTAIIAAFKTKSPDSFKNVDDPMHDAMEWYQNKPSRSAPPPDKESSSYYSDLFGGGRKNNED